MRRAEEEAKEKQISEARVAAAIAAAPKEKKTREANENPTMHSEGRRQKVREQKKIALAGRRQRKKEATHKDRQDAAATAGQIVLVRPPGPPPIRARRPLPANK